MDDGPSMSPAKTKKKAKLKPKLRPSQILTDQSSMKVDALGFGEFVSAERHVDGEATVPLKNISSRIKPRDATPTNTPHIPEHDDYDAYGFSLSSSPSKDIIVPSPCGDEESGDQRPRRPMRSPLAIRRGQSSDSYVSDESSTSEEDIASNSHQDKAEVVALRTQGSRDSVELTISRSGDEIRHASTPYSVSSIDDQGIAHELLTYSFATKLKGNNDNSDNSNNSNQNGRKAPVAALTTTSPAKIFDDQISAMKTVTAQLDTKPRPQQEAKGGKPGTFLVNIQRDSITSEASFVPNLSPNGAFKEALHEPTSEARHERSPRSSCTLDGALVYSDEEDDSKTKHKTRTIGAFSATLSFARWQMICYLCLLNLLAGWTCFSTVPYSSLFPDAEFHMVLYLFGYILSSLSLPILLSSLGLSLRKTVVIGAMLLFAGNLLISGMGSDDDSEIRHLQVGFLLAGISQPMYQNTADSLVKSWFPDDERELVLAFQRESSKLGAAVSFGIAALDVETAARVGILTTLSGVLFFIVALQFEDTPPTPLSGIGTVRVIKGRHDVRRLSPLAMTVDGHLGLSGQPSSGAGRTLTKRTPLPRRLVETNDDGNDSAYGRPSEVTVDHEEGCPLVDTPVDTPTSIPSYGSVDATLVGTQYSNGQSADTHILRPRPTTNAPPTFPVLHRGDKHRQCQPCLPLSAADERSEIILTQTPHHLDVNIKADQMLAAIRSCLARDNYIQCLALCSCSAAVFDVVLAFVDSLLDSQGDLSTGLVGYAFLMLGMASSAVFVRFSEKKYRAILTVTSTLGVFALLACIANYRLPIRLTEYLMLVASLFGPMAPLASKLGIKQCHPSDDGMVLSVQDILSRLLSVLSILAFKSYGFAYLATLSVVCTFSFCTSNIRRQ